MLADKALGVMVYGLALCSSGVVIADEPEAPELEFLEYLGMWEETDEDWQVLNETLVVDNEERSDPVPEGEESTEKEDES
jgi:hypothetical protein